MQGSHECVVQEYGAFMIGELLEIRHIQYVGDELLCCR